MKRLKALFKVEAKPALFVGIYLLVVNIFAIMQQQNIISNMWNNYMVYGIADAFDNYYTIDLYSRITYESTVSVIIFQLIGIVTLVLLSFKNDKNGEVGRFLKSLPYTVRERSFVKVSMGFLTYTITYAVYAIGTYCSVKNVFGKFGEIYRVTTLEAISDKILSMEQALAPIVLTYVIVVAVYLFLVMTQYAVNSLVGGMVIGSLTAVSPIFILASLYACFNSRDLNRILDQVSKIIIDIVEYIPIYYEGQGIDAYELGYNYLTYCSLRVIVFIIVSIILIGLIHYFNNKQLIEKEDILLPNKVIRIIFMVGVTVCSSLLAGDLYRAFLERIFMYKIENLRYFMMLIGGIAGAVISYKIAHIGLRAAKGGKTCEK